MEEKCLKKSEEILEGMYEGTLEEIYRRIPDRIYKGGIPDRFLELLHRGIPGVISERRIEVISETRKLYQKLNAAHNGFVMQAELSGPQIQQPTTMLLYIVRSVFLKSLL